MLYRGYIGVLDGIYRVVGDTMTVCGRRACCDGLAFRVWGSSGLRWSRSVWTCPTVESPLHILQNATLTSGGTPDILNPIGR